MLRIWSFIVGLLAISPMTSISAEINASDFGIYVLTDRNHQSTGMYYRLSEVDGKPIAEAKLPGGDWTKFSCREGCDYRKTLDTEMKTYFSAKRAAKSHIDCIQNTANAFCRMVPKESPEIKRYAVVALADGISITLPVQRIAQIPEQGNSPQMTVRVLPFDVKLAGREYEPVETPLEKEGRLEFVKGVLNLYRGQISEQIQKDILSQKITLGMSPYQAKLAAGWPLFEFGLFSAKQASADQSEKSGDSHQRQTFMTFENSTQFPCKKNQRFEVYFPNDKAYTIKGVPPNEHAFTEILIRKALGDFGQSMYGLQATTDMLQAINKVSPTDTVK